MIEGIKIFYAFILSEIENFYKYIVKRKIKNIIQNILSLDKNDWNNLAFMFGIVCLIVSSFMILFSKYYSNTLAVTGIALLFITMFISYRDER